MWTGKCYYSSYPFSSPCSRGEGGGCKFWILVSLRMFRAKCQYFELPRSCLVFRKKNRITQREKEVKFSFFFFFFFFKWSLLGGQNLLKPRPDWSPLAVKFKISNEHPSLFHIGVPPGCLLSLSQEGQLK